LSKLIEALKDRIQFSRFTMWYVYILQSKEKVWRYVGYTSDLRKRFESHNLEKNQATKNYASFKLEAYIAVNSESKAKKLEKYFKTGSGKAVLVKRILQSTKL
jgi:predicted GIY-YIG superfamily endonuclease